MFPIVSFRFATPMCQYRDNDFLDFAAEQVIQECSGAELLSLKTQVKGIRSRALTCETTVYDFVNRSLCYAVLSMLISSMFFSSAAGCNSFWMPLVPVDPVLYGGSRIYASVLLLSDIMTVLELEETWLCLDMKTTYW